MTAWCQGLTESIVTWCHHERLLLQPKADSWLVVDRLEDSGSTRTGLAVAQRSTNITSNKKWPERLIMTWLRKIKPISTLNAAPSGLQVTATAADDARQAQSHQFNAWPKMKYVHSVALLHLGYNVEKWAGTSPCHSEVDSQQISIL